MKRMNEVFLLPVGIDKYGLNDASNRTLIDGFDALEVHLKAAAHAINNVDKLADALEESLAMLFIAYNLHYGTGIDDPVIAKLRAVLDDYRGEK